MTALAKTPERSEPSRFRLPAVLQIPNFRLLWLGEGISLLGDQFYLIALPWLVLQLTGDSLAVGTVLALAGIPRALFMLIGGAATDRFSPRTVMLASNLVRLGLTGLLSLLIFTSSVQVWMLYIIALLFGLADAFFFPAQSAITPRLVPEAHLQSANGLMQGTAQLSVFLGPVLAGGIIALLSGSSTEAVGGDTRGTAIAFAFDALTFFISVLTLLPIVVPEADHTVIKEEESGVFGAISAGLSYVWNDATIRTFFILIAIGNFLVSGAMSVGIPVLADTRFPEGAAAFGILMSAFGGGSLIGTVLALVLPQPPARWLGIVVTGLWSLMGIGIGVLGLTTSTLVGGITQFITGLAIGYVQIMFITWLQKRTPAALMGRMMSLLMFALLGLQHISESRTGAAISTDATALFVGGGILMTTITLLSLLSPATRRMGEPVPAST